MCSLVFLPAALCWWALKITITIIRFVQRHKVVTSETLGPGSVLVNRGKRESLEKEECLDLKAATESQLRAVFGSEFQRQPGFANVVVVKG